LVCSVLGITLWVEHALKIKRASIDMRGKDDKKDALRIAEYCIRYIDKLVPFKEPSKIVQEISHLSKSRETLLTQRVAIENQLKEAETHDNFEYKILSKTYRATLRTLTKSIKKIEALIETLIDQDDEIKETRNLLVSIPGIGKQCAIHLIITTDNFTRFDNANHLACYAGVAPFKNESGKIVKRARVSKMSNKNIKRLLHMAAMAAIKSNPQLKTYFKRKVEEGKNKMSVLNAVRNKLVHRIMAVISRKTPYLPQEVFLLK
jgi:transposase